MRELGPWFLVLGTSDTPLICLARLRSFHLRFFFLCKARAKFQNVLHVTFEKLIGGGWNLQSST